MSMKNSNDTIWNRTSPMFRVEYFIVDYKFRRVVNVVFYLLGDSPAPEFYVPTFRNIVLHLHGWFEQQL
jgi:hypothetical protein